MKLEAFLASGRRRWVAPVAIGCLALCGLAWPAAGASASTAIEERDETDLVSPADVEKVVPAPGGGDRVLLDDDAALPDEGKPVVVPISAVAPEGVLGVVTEIRDSGNGATVETRPVPLARAYSEIELEDRTLGELTRGTAALTLLAQQFECTGSGRVDGPKVKPGLEDLELDLHMNLPRRELRVVLAGQPKIGVTISASGEARCRYAGNASLPIVIPGTPILLEIAPAARTKTSGSFSSSFSWGPKIAIGVDKPSGEPARGVHTISTPRPELPSFEGRARASLFLGIRLSLSVAGRAGIQGTAGPEIAADLKADNAAPCLTATSAIAYDLSAFAKVFVKRWDLPLTGGVFAVKPLWERGACPPVPGPVPARA